MRLPRKKTAPLTVRERGQLGSERAQISDPRVRRLADQIIESQRNEIDEMKALTCEIQTTGIRPGTSVSSPAGSGRE
jgi:hypothetical protein